MQRGRIGTERRLVVTTSWEFTETKWLGSLGAWPETISEYCELEGWSHQDHFFLEGSLEESYIG